MKPIFDPNDLPKWLHSSACRWGLFGLMSLMALASLGHQGYDLMEFINRPNSAPQAQLNAPVKQPKVNYPLPQWNLFGQLNSQPKAVAPPPPKDLPETKLNLELRGVSLASVASQSSAIIMNGRKEAHSYRVSEAIQPGVELLTVFADRVVISHRGRQEVLKFPDIIKTEERFFSAPETPDEAFIDEDYIAENPSVRSPELEAAYEQSLGQEPYDDRYLDDLAFSDIPADFFDQLSEEDVQAFERSLEQMANEGTLDDASIREKILEMRSNFMDKMRDRRAAGENQE